MLLQIIEEFRQARGVITRSELGRRLGVEASALEGMLQLLVRQGKLREVGTGNKTCAHCPVSGCAQMKGSSATGRAYQLATEDCLKNNCREVNDD
ncbi:MAG: hypothetical protein KAI14_05960 [Dehalococcoidales bacterium]|nr:hypothetical protein [Dehalococcoidales bacterium]